MDAARDWYSVKTTFREGPPLTGVLQDALMKAYVAHVSAGRGYLRGAGMFARSDIAADTYDFFFSPEVMQLVGPMVRALPNGVACEAPPRHIPGGASHYDGRLSLLWGEATAWDLAK